MFGAPLKSFCLNNQENNGQVDVVESFENNNNMKVTSSTTIGELCAMKDMNDQADMVAQLSEEAPVEEAPVEEAPVEEAPVEEAPVEEAPVEEAPVEEAPVEEDVTEGFGNRVMFGKHFLSLDLALRAVLYALLFYIVSHKDTQDLLKRLVNMLPKAVKPFTPMLLFGILYYVLNLFI
jgi:hypothetical protein